MSDTAAPKNLKSARHKAEQLDVSVKTVKRWAAAGLITPPIKINGRDYFDDTMPRPDAAARRTTTDTTTA